ncbi:MAG: LysR family transcriptional regulator [Candidatus Dormibacteria bacterium]
MLELRDLRALTAVIEAGGMARAGEHLHLVQSAVSQAIKRLEVQVRQPLLERRRSGVVPTPAGAALNAHAQLILNCVARAEDDMRAYRGLTKGTVRLGLVATVSRLLLGPLLRELAERHPGLLLQVEENVTDALIDRLRSGSLDLCVVYLPTETHGLTFEEVQPVRLCLAVPRGHATASRDKVELRELATERWVAFQAGNPSRRWLETNCAGAGYRPTIAVEVTSVHQLLSYVGAEVGIGMLTAQAARAEQPNDAVRTLEIADTLAPVMLGYAYNAHQPSPAIQAVKNALTDMLRDNVG